MGTQFRMDSIPGSLVVVGGTYEPWLSVLEQVGWQCTQCADLRFADNLLTEIGPCIGVIDLSHDEFSLNGIANLVSNHKQVRWLAFIRESQLGSESICQFIVNFCIDFFTAPIPDAQLLSTIGHQLGMLKLEKKVWPMLGDNQYLDNLGESMPMKRLKEQVRRVSLTEVSIFINGEQGTEKERVAKSIHHMSERANAPLIIVNCAALNHSEEESHFFINSDPAQPSLLEQANGGTLILNNILSLPQSYQSKLLHFFQASAIDKRGKLIKLNVRILSTNSEEIETVLLERGFNEELYHYINVLRVDTPSLRERSEDIPLLVRHYLLQYAQDYNVPARSFSLEAMCELQNYIWPGNLLQLKNVIKRVAIMSNSIVIEAEQLQLPKDNEGLRSLKSIRERSEKNALKLALDSYKGQVSLAAKELKVSRATMYRLLTKHGLLVEEPV
ncbi:sigma-54-dependent Fis family transcriptional regulator [Vibrio sp. 10N.286.49.B3]|uniref:sigma-54-dependent transcriptional regulator n=1 Tax=Vibrio sp. 10N.286.49.B3 TaxID=1880855 RepID=UPI000C820295|nr:VpsR-related response regulator [Vibrio sp. 10N.286.49.B3]PMH39745.1 sigma-54-dependent Fis family transcriptional regulator [Vibrio sp. 10N.286.49.B3]